ncbi:MAG: thymidine kinase [Devosiaceae bacterium]|nr:thymidine kinase [Devosiaceae bacterium MH13]
MAKLHFHYSTMNAGKSTMLLQAAHNYAERGMATMLLTAQLDDRAGEGTIGSRIGITQKAETYTPETDLYAFTIAHLAKVAADKADRPACILIDEAQFLTEDQVWQLARVVDDVRIPVMAYGLRVDFAGQLFPGSRTLLAIADEMREVRTICWCGKKASMVVRVSEEGKAVTGGAQVEVGGNDRYVSLCRKHWRQAIDEANGGAVRPEDPIFGTHRGT